MEKCICGHPKRKHRRERVKKFPDLRQNPFIFCECSICECKRYQYDGESEKRDNSILVEHTKLNLSNPFDFFEPVASKRRGTLEMIISILLVCQTPINKTHIIYKSNINCSVLSLYLKKLVELKFIEKIINERSRGRFRGKPSKKHYKTTLFGNKFLLHVCEMRNMWCGD